MCKDGNHNWGYGVLESIGSSQLVKHCLNCNVLEHIMPDKQVSPPGDSLNDRREKELT